MKNHLLLLLALLAAPGATGFAADAVINAGQTVHIKNLERAQGGTALRYQWTMSKDGAPFMIVANATDSTYTTPPGLARGRYVYKRWAYTDECRGGIAADSFVIEVQLCAGNPRIVSITNGYFCYEVGTASIGATASGGAVVDWYADSLGETLLMSGSSTYYVAGLSNTEAHHSYYARARTAAEGCSGDTLTEVRALRRPQMTPPTSVGVVQQACYNGSSTLQVSALPANANTIRWYADSLGGAPLIQASIFYTPALTAEKPYYVSGYNDLTGCESATRTQVIATVYDQIAAPVTTGVLICENGPTTLSAKPGTGGAICRWYETTTSAVILSQSNSYLTPSLSLSTGASKSYYASTYDATTGCESTRSEAKATKSANGGLSVAVTWVPSNGELVARARATGGTPPYSYTFASTNGLGELFTPVPTTKPTAAASINTGITTQQSITIGTAENASVYATVRDSKGCQSTTVRAPTGTGAVKIQLPSGATYCPACGLEGGIGQVDMWIVRVDSAPITADNLRQPAQAEFSIDDGIANTNRLSGLTTALKGKGLTSCVTRTRPTNTGGDRGVWYVPAYSEVRRAGNTIITNLGYPTTTTCSTIANTGTSWPFGIVWNPGEPNDSNDGITSFGEGCLSGTWQTASANDSGCTKTLYTYCAWRP